MLIMRRALLLWLAMVATHVAASSVSNSNGEPTFVRQRPYKILSPSSSPEPPETKPKRQIYSPRLDLEKSPKRLRCLDESKTRLENSDMHEPEDQGGLCSIDSVALNSSVEKQNLTDQQGFESGIGIGS